jgi:site-specific recombinase XerD
VIRDGSGWVARLDLPPGPNGKRRRRKRRARTKTEAIAALKQMQREVDEAINPDGARRTVAEAVASYVAVQQNTKRSPKTIQMEQWRATMIVAGLGRKAIGKLTVRDCDTFLRHAANGEFGSRTMGRETLNRVRSLLVKVLRNEMRMDNITRNVAELSVLPGDLTTRHHHTDHDDGDSSTSMRRTLSYDEFRRLWRIARSPLVVAIELCGRNGLRPSEARALRWECIDLEAKTLTVNRQMSNSETLTEPKTKRSRRTIPIDGLTVECLAGWQAIQNTKRGRAGDLWTAEPALVLTTRSGSPLNRNNLARMLTAACEEAGIDRIVPYELRHTAITFQLDAGHETWQVADWAGTSERMISDIYRHRLTRVSTVGPVNVDVWEAVQ